MPKVLAYINECLECPHRHYATSGQYECGMMHDAGFLPNFGREKPPEWCPLPNAPLHSLSQSPEVGEAVAWISDAGMDCLRLNATAEVAPQGMREESDEHPLYTASQLSAAVAQERGRVQMLETLLRDFLAANKALVEGEDEVASGLQFAEVMLRVHDAVTNSAAPSPSPQGDALEGDAFIEMARRYFDANREDAMAAYVFFKGATTPTAALRSNAGRV